MMRRRATRVCNQRVERTSNKKVFTGKAVKKKAMRRPNLTMSQKLMGMETTASLTKVMKKRHRATKRKKKQTLLTKT